MIIESLIIASALYGQVSNQYGRVGIRLNLSGNVTHVYNHSPARGLIYEGDKIIEADGHRGYEYTDGTAGSIVVLKIKRGKEIKVFEITRVSKDQVYD